MVGNFVYFFWGRGGGGGLQVWGSILGGRGRMGFLKCS